MNYFDTKNVAERYEKGRPFFHQQTIGRIKNFLGQITKFDNALDIACGT